MRIRRRAAALGALLLATCAASAGGEPGPEPIDAVRATLDRARVVVQGEGSRDAKLVRLEGVARELLDTDAMGREALGETLASQSPAEQREFLDLFDEVIVRAYLRRLLFFRNPDFGFGEQTIDGETALVRTRIETRKDRYAVDYPMRLAEGRWRATDIVVEGISITGNYREQFESLLRHHSFAELLDRMRRKTRRGRDAA